MKCYTTNAANGTLSSLQIDRLSVCLTNPDEPQQVKASLACVEQSGIIAQRSRMDILERRNWLFRQEENTGSNGRTPYILEKK